jgi:outer membrane protein assembly factor BamB
MVHLKDFLAENIFFRSVLKLSLVIAAVSAAFGHRASAEDWPQWMGPGRDNVWRPVGSLAVKPNETPKQRWSAKVGSGYSGVAVVGDRVFATDFVTTENVKVDNFGRKPFSGTERVLCLNAISGDLLWKYEYPLTTTVSYPAGPRCTPVVDGDRVYSLGAEGHLACLDIASGQVLWNVELTQAYGAKSALWGYAAHPMIDGPRLLTLAGIKGNQTVALDKMTGKEIWKYGTATEQGYSPPTMIEAAGKRQLILANPNAVNSVNPETGEQYWSVPYEASNGSIIMSPIQVGEYLFVGGYSNRNLMIQLDQTKPGAKVLWKDKAKHGMSPVNVQPMAIGSVIYGCDQSGEMMAFEVPSGKRLWETSKPVSERPQGSGTAFVVRYQDRFVLFNESGELIIAEMDAAGYRELSRVKLIKPTNNAFGREVVWCAPAFANGAIYIRNDEELLAFDLMVP